jgi:hypothetical protein
MAHLRNRLGQAMSDDRRLIQLLGFAGLIILLHQGLDLWAAVFAADTGTPTGRLGIIAVTWSRSPSLLAADLFLVVAIVRSSDPRLLRVLGGVHLALGLAALAAAPFFLTDAGRVTANIAAAELTSFRITVARILVALLVTGVGAIVTAVSLVQAGRAETKAA